MCMEQPGSLGKRAVPQNANQDREYVIRTRQNPCAGHSLAHHIGLVDEMCVCPKSLSENEWTSVKLRCMERRDPFNRCPICHEDFGLRQSIILSCSHLFHKNCLDSYERFCETHCCPICRAQDYEKRVIYFTKSAYYHKMAARIQAAWRACKARRQCVQLRKRATRPMDPKVCEQRLLHRIHGLSSSVIHLCRSGAHDDEVAQILREADQAMEQSESAMHQLDLKLNRMKHSEDVILSPTEWSHAWRSHLRRGTSTCPICLCTWTANRERVLLSCSHTFHKVCLERLELMRGQTSDDEQQPVIISCPICRWAGYRKLKIPGLDGLLLD